MLRLQFTGQRWCSDEAPMVAVWSRPVMARRTSPSLIGHNYIAIMLDGIPVAAVSGDEGMTRLMAAGEPGRSFSALAGLIDRIPAIDRHLR